MPRWKQRGKLYCTYARLAVSFRPTAGARHGVDVGFSASGVNAIEQSITPQIWPRSPQENAFRGLAAVNLIIPDVLAKGYGRLTDAMRRSGLPGGQPGITFRWETPGTGPIFRGGSGLSHIIAKHGVEVMEDVIDTVAKGKIVRVPGDPNRVLIESSANYAVLRLTRD